MRLSWLAWLLAPCRFVGYEEQTSKTFGLGCENCSWCPRVLVSFTTRKIEKEGYLLPSLSQLTTKLRGLDMCACSPHWIRLLMAMFYLHSSANATNGDGELGDRQSPYSSSKRGVSVVWLRVSQDAKSLLEILNFDIASTGNVKKALTYHYSVTPWLGLADCLFAVGSIICWTIVYGLFCAYWTARRRKNSTHTLEQWWKNKTGCTCYQP